MPLLSAGAEPAKLGLCGTFLWVLPCSHEVKDHVSYHPLESTNHSFSSFDRWMLRSVPCSCRARHSLRTLDWETGDMGSCWSNNPADYWKINKHRMESRAAMRNNRRGWGLQDTDQALGEAESQTTWKASLHQAAPSSASAPRTLGNDKIAKLRPPHPTEHSAENRSSPYCVMVSEEMLRLRLFLSVDSVLSTRHIAS